MAVKRVFLCAQQRDSMAAPVSPLDACYSTSKCPCLRYQVVANVAIRVVELLRFRASAQSPSLVGVEDVDSVQRASETVLVKLWGDAGPWYGSGIDYHVYFVALE